MKASATAKYIRVAPRKLLNLVGAIKNLRPTEALAKLEYTEKSGAKHLYKVIASAISNAKNLQIADATGLTFEKIEVLPGSAMKRFRAVSRGMAHTYKKRMSHIRVVLTEEIKSQNSMTRTQKSK